jgi:hypothetical protein
LLVRAERTGQARLDRGASLEAAARGIGQRLGDERSDARARRQRLGGREEERAIGVGRRHEHGHETRRSRLDDHDAERRPRARRRLGARQP